MSTSLLNHAWDCEATSTFALTSKRAVLFEIEQPSERLRWSVFGRERDEDEVRHYPDGA